MNHGWGDFVVGLLFGGLGLSAGWGLFWLGVGMIGWTRGTCHWRVVFNSVTVGFLPLLLMAGVWWYSGPYDVSPALGVGLLGMPLILLGFGLRPAPDGQRAGVHMLEGVRHLMDELLGKHHGCSGCDHKHDHEGCA